jgi:hypothetical protein
LLAETRGAHCRGTVPTNVFFVFLKQQQIGKIGILSYNLEFWLIVDDINYPDLCRFMADCGLKIIYYPPTRDSERVYIIYH